MKKIYNQKGSIHTFPLLLIVAAVGIISFLLISSTAPFQGGLFNQTNPKPASHAATSGCGLTNPVFCDTFDAPAGIGNRSGDLNGTIWGVSREIGEVNFSNGHNNAAPATALVGCNGTTTVRPPNDIIICNGQLREATNDNPSGAFEAGGVTALAMYPKQPFDFAGRTGKITFDVGDDSHGSHGAWPEFWMSNLPIPVPFEHFFTFLSLPQFGFGLRFDGYVDGNGNANACPEGTGYTGVGSAIIINNYIPDDFDNSGHSMTIHGSDCVKQPTQTGQLNHFEVDVSQNQIDVYGTDAGTTAPLKHLATIPNANLGFTRGLIWLEDVHYNADKADMDNPSLSQKQHTFVWDNVGFDGPFTYHDLSYDALDNNTANSDGTVNLGKASGPNQTASWDVLNMPANPVAEAVRVLFNFYTYDPPTVINVSVNGHAHSVPWPYPVLPAEYNTGFTWRTYAVTIPITDLVTGTNVVTIGGDQTMATSNVNIVLVNAGATSTPTPAPSVPPTPISTPTPGVESAFNGPHNLPGTLQTEDYDNGGEGVAYHDLDSANQGGAYRTNQGVDVEATTDTGGGFDVGWTMANEYLKYMVNVSASGMYNLGFRVASLGAGGTFHLEVDGTNVTGTMTVPDTTDWQAFTTLTKSNVSLTAGAHTLRLVMDTNGVNGYIGNINYITFAQAGSSTPSPTPGNCPKATLGDVDCDNTIGIFDYNILVGNFNKVGTGIQGDLDNSGKVDIFDYNTLSGNFGK